MAKDSSGIEDVFGVDFIKEVENMELLTQEKVSSTLSAIEVAIAAYDAAKEKVPDLRERIGRLRRIKIDLEHWEKESLKNRHVNDLNARIERLRKFTEICDSFA